MQYHINHGRAIVRLHGLHALQQQQHYNIHSAPVSCSRREREQRGRNTSTQFPVDCSGLLQQPWFGHPQALHACCAHVAVACQPQELSTSQPLPVAQQTHTTLTRGRLLTRYGVDPVTDVVPAGHQRRSFNIDELHVVHVHVEGVLLRSLQEPLLDLVNGHVNHEVFGPAVVLVADRLSNQEAQPLAIQGCVDQVLKVVGPGVRYGAVRRGMRRFIRGSQTPLKKIK